MDASNNAVVLEVSSHGHTDASNALLNFDLQNTTDQSPAMQHDQLAAEELLSQELAELKVILQERGEQIDSLVREKCLAEQSLAATHAELTKCQEQLHQRDSNITLLQRTLAAHQDGSFQILLHSLQQKLAAEVQVRESAQAAAQSLRGELLQAQQKYNEACKRTRQMNNELMQAQLKYNEECEQTGLLKLQNQEMEREFVRNCEFLRTKLRAATSKAATLQRRMNSTDQRIESTSTAEAASTVGSRQDSSLPAVWLPPEYSAEMADLQVRLWELQEELRSTMC
jgi:chromosome segregation ATPase